MVSPRPRSSARLPCPRLLGDGGPSGSSIGLHSRRGSRMTHSRAEQTWSRPMGMGCLCPTAEARSAGLRASGAAGSPCERSRKCRRRRRARALDPLAARYAQAGACEQQAGWGELAAYSQMANCEARASHPEARDLQSRSCGHGPPAGFVTASVRYRQRDRRLDGGCSDACNRQTPGYHRVPRVCRTQCGAHASSDIPARATRDARGWVPIVPTPHARQFGLTNRPVSV